MNRRVGFTLIELLVVVAILALLIAILMPALTAAREQGRKCVCAQNEKNAGLGLFLYAQDNDGKLMDKGLDYWLFDVSYWTTDVVLRAGDFDRRVFYCPSYPERNKIYYWRWSECLGKGAEDPYPEKEPASESDRKYRHHRITGYFWMLDYYNVQTKTWKEPPFTYEGESSKEWVKSIVSTKHAPAMVELLTDVTISTGPDRHEADFTAVTGGVWTRWREYDRTSHIKSNKCTGSNILFVDGHVQWRKFSEMDNRWGGSYASFWW